VTVRMAKRTGQSLQHGLNPSPFRPSAGAKCLAHVWKRCTAFHSVAPHCTCQQPGWQKRGSPLGVSGLKCLETKGCWLRGGFERPTFRL